MINNTILNADGNVVRFQDVDGELLQFATEARPAKRAFAWHAEAALRLGKGFGWPAAFALTVPGGAWGSDTCDSSIRNQYFRDVLQLQGLATPTSESSEGLPT